MQLLIRRRGRREKWQMYCETLSSLNHDDAVWGGGSTLKDDAGEEVQKRRE